MRSGGASSAQASKKLLPIFRLLGAKRERVRLFDRESLAAAHDAAARTGGAQLRGQSLAQSGRIGENEPRFFHRRFRRRRQRLRAAATALRASRPIWPSPPSGRCRPGSDAVSAKPASLQRASPIARAPATVARGRRSRSVKCHQPLVRPKTVSVHKLRRRDVHEDEAAAGREQIVQMVRASRARRSRRAARWCR